MSGISLTALSRKISLALRHEPEQYGIELDEMGWTAVSDLIAGLRRRHPYFAGVEEADLEAVIARPGKQRYEMNNGRIRALYGHSVPVKIYKEAQPPPAILYHGTSPQAAARILQEGLKPMRRQYVHLSTDVQTAQIVGRRKTRQPQILEVQAQAAFAAGVGFYDGNDTTWLADPIPAGFIQLVEEEG